MNRCESWTIKNAEHWRIYAFEQWFWKRLLRVSWTARKDIKPVNSKGNQPWIFIERIDAKAEAPILWLPDAKSWLTGKDPDTRKDWGQEEKEVTEGAMVGWHHRFNGQTPFLSELREIMKVRIPWRAAVHGVAKSQAWLNDNKQWCWWGYHSPQGECNTSTKGSLGGLQQCGLILNLWGTKSPECFSTPQNLSCLPNTLPLSHPRTIIMGI